MRYLGPLFTAGALAMTPCSTEAGELFLDSSSISGYSFGIEPEPTGRGSSALVSTPPIQSTREEIHANLETNINARRFVLDLILHYSAEKNILPAWINSNRNGGITVWKNSYSQGQDYATLGATRRYQHRVGFLIEPSFRLHGNLRDRIGIEFRSSFDAF